MIRIVSPFSETDTCMVCVCVCVCVCVVDQPRPSDHVITWLEDGAVSQSAPLAVYVPKKNRLTAVMTVMAG